MRAIVAVTGMLAITACGAQDPTDTGADLRLELSFNVIQQPHPDSIYHSTVRHPRGVHVLGTIVLGATGGYELTGSVSLYQSSIVLTVVPRMDGIGLGLPAYYRYMADITGVPPGRYSITVIEDSEIPRIIRLATVDVE